MSELEILAKKIKEQDYEIAFGITGSGLSYSLIKHLTDLGLKYVTVSNEAVAAIAAGTYNYYNKKKALSITIKGPGFANVLAGITACYFERFEMLNISEAYASNSSLEAMHKRLNQLEMIKPVIKNISSLSYINELESFLEDDYLNSFPKHFELANVTTHQMEKSKIELDCNPKNC